MENINRIICSSLAGETPMIKPIAILGAGLALLASCLPKEYETATPVCFTGTVQKTSIEQVLKDFDNTGPYYTSRLVRQIQTDEGKPVFLHGIGPSKGRVRVCVYAPEGYAEQQDHFFELMRDPTTFFQNDTYKVTAEETK